ncbi:MAG: hypothetical protein ACLPTZ_15625 [Beijerinckiaceae bacterium]
MSKNEKQGGINPHHIRLVLNQSWRGHSTEVEKIISILRKAGLVAADDLPLSAAADPSAKIPTAAFSEALAGLPIEGRLRAKAMAYNAGLID